MKSIHYYLRSIVRFFMPHFASPIEKMPGYEHLNRPHRSIRQHALALNDATRLILCGPPTVELEGRIQYLTHSRYIVLGIIPDGTSKLALAFYPINEYDQAAMENRKPGEHVLLSEAVKHASLLWVMDIETDTKKVAFLPCYQAPPYVGAFNLMDPSLCVEIDLPYDFAPKYLD